MIDIFKRLSTTKPPTVVFDIDECLIITKLSEEDFPYKDFIYQLKYQKESEGGNILDVNCPATVRLGQYRKNIMYRTSFSSYWVVYMARGEGLFKVSGYNQLIPTNNMAWGQSNEIRSHWYLFINYIYKYRHKSLEELRNLTIMKLELGKL